MRGGVFTQRQPYQRHAVRGDACAIVRSSSSSCCWFNRSLMTVSAMEVSS